MRNSTRIARAAKTGVKVFFRPYVWLGGRRVVASRHRSLSAVLPGILLFLLAFAGASALAQVRPIPVPGRIEAEHYDTNGVGVSFYDTTPGNSGSVYRSDDVDIEATSDTGGGYDVGWIASGEWLVYTLNVQTTAVYQLSFRAASGNGTGNIQVSLDGVPLCAVTTPYTGGWQTWQTVIVSNLVIASGQRTLRLDFKVGGQNLNYIQAAKQSDFNSAFLRASGQQIVNAQGQNVLLRGMGLGNWMLQEPYMMEVSGIADTQQQLKAKIAELVGTNNLDAFYRAWLSNYVREADVAALANAGFNSIRLPMHYNLFTLPIQQEPVPGQNTWLTNGFKLVDDLLGWCETNHLYLILDMHACPGGQGHDQPISDYEPSAPSLWESATNRAKLVALWHELAARYSTRAWIGGYDLINEPNWSFETNQAESGCNDMTNAPLRQLLVDITAAIRQVDTNHLIIIEGNCWAGNYSGVLPPWDSNLAISFHKYWDQPTAASLQPWIDKRNQWNMPVWLGESGENSNEWFREVVRNCEQANIGWAWWPWKKLNSISAPTTVTKPPGYQAILNYWNSTGPRPSTNDATAALFALADASRYENCVKHPDVVDALMRPSTAGVTLPFKSRAFSDVAFAIDYDLGRIGEAFADQTTNSPYNTGSLYRNDSVDIEACGDATPTLGYDVGWLDAGDWMKYTMQSLPAGPYSLAARVASGNGGGSFHIEVSGSNVTGSLSVPATGGWQSWTTLQRPFTNTLPATSYRVVVDTGGFNLNWLQLASLLPGAPSNLTASATSTQVNLLWPPVSGATSYRVKRSMTSGGNFTVIAAGIAGTTFADTNVTNGSFAYYVVSAVNAYGEGAPSPEAGAFIPFPLLAAQFASNQVVLIWSNAASTLAIQSSTSIFPLAAWSPVTNPRFFQNGTWQLPWIPVDSTRFFRLSSQ